MSHWNYRVMRHEVQTPSGDETYYAIHEVYYTEDGKIDGWAEDASGSPSGDTFEEMIRDLAWIIAAVTKPILDAETGNEVEPASMAADDIAKLLTGTKQRIAVEALGDGE